MARIGNLSLNMSVDGRRVEEDDVVGPNATVDIVVSYTITFEDTDFDDNGVGARYLENIKLLGEDAGLNLRDDFIIELKPPVDMWQPPFPSLPGQVTPRIIQIGLNSSLFNEDNVGRDEVVTLVTLIPQDSIGRRISKKSNIVQARFR